VKELIQELLSETDLDLNLDKSKVVRLLDDSLQILEEDECIKIIRDTEKSFFLCKGFKDLINDDICEVPVEDLITQVTDAKEKLHKKYQPNILLKRSPNFFRIHGIYEPVNFNRISVQRQSSNIPVIIFTTSNTNLDNNNYIHNQAVHTIESNEIEAYDNLVFQLNEMGFPVDKCKRALVLARNNIDRATDILFNDELDYLPSSSDNLVGNEIDNQHGYAHRMGVDDSFDYIEMCERFRIYLNNYSEAEEEEFRIYLNNYSEAEGEEEGYNTNTNNNNDEEVSVDHYM